MPRDLPKPFVSVPGHITGITREDEALPVQQPRRYKIRVRLRVRADYAVVDDHTVLHRLIVGQLTGISEENGVSGIGCFPGTGILHLEKNSCPKPSDCWATPSLFPMTDPRPPLLGWHTTIPKPLPPSQQRPRLVRSFDKPRFFRGTTPRASLDGTRTRSNLNLHSRHIHWRMIHSQTGPETPLEIRQHRLGQVVQNRATHAILGSFIYPFLQEANAFLHLVWSANERQCPAG